MKKLLLLGVIFTSPFSVYALEDSKTLTVNQETLILSTDDFTPVKTQWAGRSVVTGYQVLLNVVDAEQTMFFDVSGEISARWFASNFGLVTKASCNGIPIGMSKAYGKRINASSTPAKPMSTELRKGLAGCSQIKVELFKEGSLSQQFYTRLQNISFAISVKGINSQQGAQ